MHAGESQVAIGMTVRHGPQRELIVTQRWYVSPASLAIFALWLFVFAAVPTAWLVDRGVSSRVLRDVAIWVPVALVLGYAPIALMVNKTTYTLSGAEVHVHKGPLWWPQRRRPLSLGEAYVFQLRIYQPGFARRREVVKEIVGHTRDGRELPIMRFNELFMPNGAALCRIFERHMHERRG